MGASVEGEFAEFAAKVKRTVYLDNISPQVTEAVLRTALEQFGKVKGVHFIPNYLGPKNLPQCALVEMEDAKKAKAVISTLSQYPFMISGMPRPVRARAAKEEMFNERPRKPVRKISCTWLEPSDPDFEVAKRLKVLAQKHTAETSFMLKQINQEQELANQQERALKATYKKFEMIESLITDGTAKDLSEQYKSSFR
ncbi:uncharacterized protein LOC110812947 isoform X2 [Carica papaya]|uniref:uncharacterized protein LOC110812947 isoform X2 n=1 Tax=Carica papaya TaxID=3649 RepID=UPI000B8CF5E6|nr:uncharacterized protein LOC110812947 isoform X2 [Carica papaya]